MNKYFYKIFFLVNWKKKIFPLIIQSLKNKVLMLGWANKWNLIESYFYKKTCFWSRSKKIFWRKGYESFNFQIIKNFYFDCDIDSYLIIVNFKKKNCHYNLISCYKHNLY